MQRPSRLEAKADAIGLRAIASGSSPRGSDWPSRATISPSSAGWLTHRSEDLEPWAYEMPAALLDGLVALGDRGSIEAEAPKWLRPNTYVEPFALRALGFARADESMLADAACVFEAMELDWFAGQTLKLLATFE